MDFETKLAAIFAGIDALAGTAKAFSDLWAKCKTELSSADLSDIQTLLKASASAIASVAHGDPAIATKLKADVASGLHKVGHLFGTVLHDAANVIDPTQSVTTTVTPAPSATTEPVAVAAGKTS